MPELLPVSSFGDVCRWWYSPCSVFYCWLESDLVTFYWISHNHSNKLSHFQSRGLNYDLSCFLRESADKVVLHTGKYEELIVCSHEIAASTAQLVAASKVLITAEDVQLKKTLTLTAEICYSFFCFFCARPSHGHILGGKSLLLLCFN